MAPIRCCFDQTAVWHSDAARGPSTPSFDHLVGAAQQRDSEHDAERPGGLDIDNQLKFHRLLDGQIAGLGSLENFSGVDADLSICIGKNGSIAHQATGHWKISPLIHRRYGVAGGEGGDMISSAVEKRLALDEQCSGALSDESCECIVDVAVVACIEDKNLLPPSARSGLQVAPHFLAISLKASARFGESLILRIPWSVKLASKM